MEGYYPAFITESIDRAKRYNISRNNGTPSLINTDDLVLAADGLRPQLALMEGAPETPPIESLDAAFERVVLDTVNGFQLVDEHGKQVRSGEYLGVIEE